MKYLLLSLIFIAACQQRNAIENIETMPTVSEADKAFADVYKILDGTWNGQFKIYEDSQPKALGELELKKLDASMLQRAGLKLVNSIEVQQTYTSESPYFQRVQITDTYPESGKQEKSKGVNKIQNGKMWCVVKKPNEMIIHEGSLEGKSTIIWQSDNTAKKEYFYETVTEESYEIIGWGYYGNDDRTLSPRLWFYGKYLRG